MISKRLDKDAVDGKGGELPRLDELAYPQRYESLDESLGESLECLMK